MDNSIANTFIEFSWNSQHLSQVKLANQICKHSKIELSGKVVLNTEIKRTYKLTGYGSGNL